MSIQCPFHVSEFGQSLGAKPCIYWWFQCILKDHLKLPMCKYCIIKVHILLSSFYTSVLKESVILFM